jgi:hypothetical protein
MASLAEANPPVYQYVWTDHSLPGYKALVMTVTNLQGIIGLAFFTSLIAYTQKRCWILIRDHGLPKLRPIRLAPNHGSHPLEELSQGRALTILFGLGNRHNNQSMTTVPKLLGWAAIFNIIAFFASSIILPLYLTGNLKTTVVQSKFTGACIGHEDRTLSRRFTAQLADSYYKQCLGDVSSCPKESKIVGSLPKLHKGIYEACPFPGDVCQEGVQPVVLGYTGLSARDYGVNLDRRVLIDHRVICAPLKTERFLLIHGRLNNDKSVSENRTVIWFGRKFHDPAFSGGNSTLYGMILATPNGPNSLSNEYSGNYLLSGPKTPPPYDLHVYPVGNMSGVSDTIHPSLLRDDGEVFVVMFRAGRSLYSKPMDDPFFAAHNSDGSGSYIPDHEATALGCVEQFRLCLKDESFVCTGWRGRLVVTDLLFLAYPNVTKDTELLQDLLFVYIFFTDLATVQQYLFLRPGTQVLLSSFFRSGDQMPVFHQKEQWTLELEAWFVTAFLNARYALLQIVRRNGSERAPNTPKPMLKLCKTILYQNNDYTNLDLIGLLVSLSALLLICAFSFTEKTKSLAEKLVGGCIALYSIFCTLGGKFAGVCNKVWDELLRYARDLGPQVQTLYEESLTTLRSLTGYVKSWFSQRNGGPRSGRARFSGNDGIELANRQRNEVASNR